MIYVPVSKTLYFGELSLGAYKIENISGEVSLDLVMAEGVKLPIQKNENNYVVVGSRSHMSSETESVYCKTETKTC